VILDGNKLKGVPSECFESQVMLWHMDMPTFTLNTEEEKEIEQQQNPKEEKEIEQQQNLMKSDEDPTTWDLVVEETSCDVTSIMYISYFIEAGTVESIIKHGITTSQKIQYSLSRNFHNTKIAVYIPMLNLGVQNFPSSGEYILHSQIKRPTHLLLFSLTTHPSPR